MISPRLTKDSSGHYDLLLENGKFSFCEDGTQAAQHSLERLLLFKGDYSHNGKLTTKTELGTKWYEIIFAMDLPRSEKEFEIKRRILETPGIERIIRFEWSQTGHSVTITGAVQTSWGEEDISNEVTPL